MDLQLKGRTALITGATAGLGKAIALSLASEGVSLAVVGRRINLLTSLKHEAIAMGAEEVVLIEQDMSNAHAASNVSSNALTELGHIDILINCMGASKKADLATSDEEWEAAMTLNWVRHRQLTEKIIPSMQKQK